MPVITPEEVAEKTESLLKRQGWCFWQCEALGNDIITLVQDRPLSERQKQDCMHQLDIILEKHSNTTNKARLGIFYTIRELEILAEAQEPKLIHEAKKMGAEILP